MGFVLTILSKQLSPLVKNEASPQFISYAVQVFALQDVF